MAKVTIIDVEWYNGYSRLPKPLCMKLSSYHKQLGDIINFAETGWQINLDFDIMYVVREGTAGTLPKEIPMHNDKVYLIGNGFRYYNRYLKELPTAIDSCRPDYLLYKIDEENNMTKANIIQFYSRNGKRLPLIQDYHRATKGSKWNLVIDEKFWEQTYDDIFACVQLLKQDKNVVFQHEIKLDNIISHPEIENLFLSLDYKRGSSMKLYYGGADWVRLCAFMDKFQTRYSNLAHLPVYVDIPYQYNHAEDPNSGIKDLTNYLSIVTKAKQIKLHIIPRAQDRNKSPFWFYFEEIESWMTYGYQKSFIEWMTLSAQRYHGVGMHTILTTKSKWSTPQIQWLMDLARNYPKELDTYGYIEWGYKKLPKFKFSSVIKENKKWKSF